MQSNEVGGSYHMEKEGLFRLMQFLSENSFTIDSLITDRHRQIAKWLRDNYPDVKHYYDVWHVAKSISSTIIMLSMQHFFNSYYFSRCAEESTSIG